jgi:hypothetical protein
VDNVEEFVDFKTDVITSLLIVLCPLVQQSEEVEVLLDSIRTSTMSIILLTVVMMPSTPGTGAIVSALAITSNDVFRPLYTSSRRFRVVVSDDIRVNCQM